jgi:putative thiamine transport system permease protein
LWVVGLHRWLLGWNLDASATGLWLAHCLTVLPYTLLTLHGPYRAVNPRMALVAATLGRSRYAYLRQVKWPLLRGPMLAALAVGFAVSVAQYLPTLYVGAGRFATVTTEAVAQASGGQRALAAAFALLQWLLPFSAFLLAARGKREKQRAFDRFFPSRTPQKRR